MRNSVIVSRVLPLSFAARVANEKPLSLTLSPQAGRGDGPRGAAWALFPVYGEKVPAGDERRSGNGRSNRKH